MKLRELCFEIVNDCYLNCVYCSSFDDFVRKKCKNYLPFLLIKQVIDDFCVLGGQLLELSGGEPLMHPELIDIVDYALDKDIDVIVYTSGVLPDSYDIQNILSKLQRIGLKKIVFNCQGLANVHDMLVGKQGAFTRLIGSIIYSKEIGLWVGIHFVPNKQNYFQIEQVYYFLKGLYVDELALLRLVPQGRARYNQSILEMRNLEYLKFFDFIYDLVQSNSHPAIRVGCPFNMINIKYPGQFEVHKCHAGIFSLDIMADGSVIPCPAFKDIPIARLGNIFKDSLIEIWQANDFLKRLRNVHSAQISFCNKCHFLDLCRGGCTAQRILKNGLLLKGPDPLCPLFYPSYKILPNKI